MSSRRLLSELLLQLTEQKQIQLQESKELARKLSKTTISGINMGEQKSKRQHAVDRFSQGEILIVISRCLTKLI